MRDDDVRLLIQAVKEALLYMEAPSGSPRHWPVARANLRELLERALKAATIKPIMGDEE